MVSFGGWQPEWNTAVIALGCVTMIVWALFALVQTDLKRLLAYSTISQLGYILTGLGLGTPAGIAAGLFYCLSHGIFKGTLFLCAGAVQHATGTRDMRQLGGLERRMPGTHRIWLVAAAAIIGVPLTNGFVAKWLLYSAALTSGQGLVVLLAWLVSTFTAFYILKATVSVFYGRLPDELQGQDIHDASPTMLAGMGFLAVLALVFGLAPQLLMKWLVVPAGEGLGMAWPVEVTWLGLQTGAMTLLTTAAAGITVLAVGAGWVFYRLTRRARSNDVPVFTGGDPLPEGDRVGAVDFSELAGTTFGAAYRLLDPDPLYLGVWHGLQAASGWAADRARGLENRAVLVWIVGALLLAAAMWIW